jgi:hypothetical protein
MPGLRHHLEMSAPIATLKEIAALLLGIATGLLTAKWFFGASEDLMPYFWGCLIGSSVLRISAAVVPTRDGAKVDG